MFFGEIGVGITNTYISHTSPRNPSFLSIQGVEVTPPNGYVTTFRTSFTQKMVTTSLT
jgi:hypothetical protein